MTWEALAKEFHDELWEIRRALTHAYAIRNPGVTRDHMETLDLLRVFLPPQAFEDVPPPPPLHPTEAHAERPEAAPEEPPPPRPVKRAGRPKPPPQAQTIREIAAEVAELVEEKGRSYGPALGASVAYLRALYPDAIPSDHYDFVCLLVRISDKIARLAGPNPGAFGESPWRDIIGYALRGAERSQHDH